MHGASLQCMQATDIERSPGTPSLIVTTRRRFTPHGISCSCLHAVTQPLHSMQRSASHRNFIRAMIVLLRQAFATWHSVVLVSCIMVTESYPYVVAVFTASPRTIGAAPSGYLSSRSLPCHQPAKWNGMKLVPGPTRSVTSALTLRVAPVGVFTHTQSQYLMPRFSASCVLISTKFSCCSSASHGLERVSSPPPSYSTRRPEVSTSGYFSATLSAMVFCCTVL